MAQEGLLSDGSLSQADVIIVGTLHHDFRFPWLDGWNERGHIQVERVLKGDLKLAPTLPFAWERDFWPGCLTRPDWRGATGKRGIWLLRKSGSRYRANNLLAAFLDPAKLDEVMQLLANPN